MIYSINCKTSTMKTFLLLRETTTLMAAILSIYVVVKPLKRVQFHMLMVSSGKGRWIKDEILFHTFKLCSNNCLGQAVDTYVACVLSTSKNTRAFYLDVTTVYSKESNTVYVNVVNRHKDKAISADVINTSGALTGKAIAILISGEKLNDPFTLDQQTQYQPATKEISVKNNTFSCTFPPHSFTQIKLGVK